MMPQTASFYDRQRRADPMEAIRARAAMNPRSRLIRSLLESGGDTRPAAGGIGEGLARIAEGLVGGWMGRKEEERIKEREQKAHSVLVRALMGEQVNAAEGPPRDFGGGVTSQELTRTPNTQGDMARILAGNPDTAGMGFDLRMQELDRQQQMADEQRRMAAENQTWQQRFQAQQEAQQQAQQAQFEQQRQLRGIPQAQAPSPGMSDRAFQQQMAMLNAGLEAKRAAKGVQLTPGQKKIDEKVATDLAPFVAGGGFADVQKGLAQLDRVEKELEKGGVTGTGVGLVPNAPLSMFNERAVDTQNLVEEVVQRNLRTILGAQFTEREGIRLIERAYNPYLSEKTNLKRVRALKKSISQAAQAKKEAWDYMQENATMKGYQGKLWSMQDFEAALDAVDNGNVSRETKGEQDGDSDVDDLVNKYRSR